MNIFTLECTFTIGSDAQGCMVVFVGESGNMTRNLMRLNSSTLAVVTVNTTIPLHCYNEVFGYDIETDGSLGTLAVQGVILRNFSSMVPCLQDELKRSPSECTQLHYTFWQLHGILSYNSCRCKQPQSCGYNYWCCDRSGIGCHHTNFGGNFPLPYNEVSKNELICACGYSGIIAIMKLHLKCCNLWFYV